MIHASGPQILRNTELLLGVMLSVCGSKRFLPWAAPFVLVVERMKWFFWLLIMLMAAGINNARKKVGAAAAALVFTALSRQTQLGFRCCVIIAIGQSIVAAA